MPQTPRTPHIPVQIRVVRALQIRVLGIIPRDHHGITAVQTAVAFLFVVVFVEQAVVREFDSVCGFVNSVGFEGSVQGEGGIGFAFEVFRVVVL